MKNPPSLAKLAKRDAIQSCLQIICEKFKVDPFHLLSEIPRKGANIRDARIFFVYHLYSCGMSFNAIGRILTRSGDTVRRLEGYGAQRFMTEDFAFLDTLPRIPNSLDISNPAPFTGGAEA